MAATHVGTTSATQTASTIVNVTRTVTAGNLLIVWHRSKATTNKTYTLSQTAGTAITFTNQIDTDTTIAGSDVVIWTGVVAVTGSITLRNTSDTNDNADFGITEVTSQDATTPVRGTGIEYNTSSSSNHDLLGTGVNVSAGDFVLGAFRLVSGTGVVTAPSGATALVTETDRGGVYWKEFGSASSGEQFRATSATARTSECGGIVIAGAAAGGSPEKRGAKIIRLPSNYMQVLCG